MTKRYLIIGNGVAGISAAEEIRKVDPTGEILILHDEERPYYYRASLSEMITGEKTPQMLAGRTPQFYENLKLTAIRAFVTHIDPVKRVAYTQKKEYPYDEVLIATGAAPRSIDIPCDQKILLYRDFSQAEEIIAALRNQPRLLIIGGGVLGLELAAAVHQLPGHQIAIVQRSPQIGRPLLDEAASDWLIQRMQTDDIALFLNDVVKRIKTNTVVMESGKTWQSDLVVAAIGVIPIYPQIPGLKINQGIQIDEYCQTNQPHVYAAGDCTEYFHQAHHKWQPSRIWLEASQQGAIAGANMAGETKKYPAGTTYNASYIYKDRYVFIGDPHGEGGQTHLWIHGDAYRKIRVVDGIVAGAVLINNRKGHLAIRDAINAQSIVKGDDLAHPNLNWNFIAKPSWDYHFF